MKKNKLWWCLNYFLLASTTTLSMSLVSCSLSHKLLANNNEYVIEETVTDIEGFSAEDNNKEIIDTKPDETVESEKVEPVSEHKYTAIPETIEVKINRELKEVNEFTDKYKNSNNLAYLHITNEKEIIYAETNGERKNINISDLVINDDLLNDFKLVIDNNRESIEDLSIIGFDLNENDFRVLNINSIQNLHRLDLSYNSIYNVNFLEEVKGLNVLSLSHNNISDVTPIINKELKNIYSLDLSYNNISDPTLVPKLSMLGYNDKGATYYHLVHNKFPREEIEALCNIYKIPDGLRELYYEGSTECFIYVPLYSKEVNYELAENVLKTCNEKIMQINN